jgi:hypothetical protein
LLFEDPGDVRALLMRIVSTERHYPEVISSTLSDLLRCILTKAPEARIDLARIKAQPVFAPLHNFFQRKGGW